MVKGGDQEEVTFIFIQMFYFLYVNSSKQAGVT